MGWRRAGKLLWVTLLATLLSLQPVSGAMAARRSPSPAKSAAKLAGKISETAPPTVIQELNRTFETNQPQVSILSPKSNQVLDSDAVSVTLRVRDLPIFKDPVLGLGPHLHVLLDNQRYQPVYDLSEPLIFENLEPGTHTLRVFASRPWHESFKNEGAYAQTRFHVYTQTDSNNPDPKLPLLTYSRPQGSYGAEPVLLDFYLTNAPLHLAAQADAQDEISDWRIQATVNGDRFTLDQWQPIYLKGLKPGKNWVKLEYIDDHGKPIANVFNNTARVINYDPNGTDTLSKLMRGELSADQARGIVDPNYVPPAPSAPEPVAEPSPSPSPTPSPEVKPTPAIVPVVPVPIPSDRGESVSPPAPKFKDTMGTEPVAKPIETRQEINKKSEPELKNVSEPAEQASFLPKEKSPTRSKSGPISPTTLPETNDEAIVSPKIEPPVVPALPPEHKPAFQKPAFFKQMQDRIQQENPFKSERSQPESTAIESPTSLPPDLTKSESVPSPTVVKPEVTKPDIPKPEIVKPEIVKPAVVDPKPVKLEPTQSKNASKVEPPKESEPIKREPMMAPTLGTPSPRSSSSGSPAIPVMPKRPSVAPPIAPSIKSQPESGPSEVKVPEVKIPEVKIPEVKIPEVKIPIANPFNFKKEPTSPIVPAPAVKPVAPVLPTTQSAPDAIESLKKSESREDKGTDATDLPTSSTSTEPIVRQSPVKDLKAFGQELSKRLNPSKLTDFLDPVKLRGKVNANDWFQQLRQRPATPDIPSASSVEVPTILESGPAESGVSP